MDDVSLIFPPIIAAQHIIMAYRIRKYLKRDSHIWHRYRGSRLPPQIFRAIFQWPSDYFDIRWCVLNYSKNQKKMKNLIAKPNKTIQWRLEPIYLVNKYEIAEISTLSNTLQNFSLTHSHSKFMLRFTKHQNTNLSCFNNFLPFFFVEKLLQTIALLQCIHCEFHWIYISPETGTFWLDFWNKHSIFYVPQVKPFGISKIFYKHFWYAIIDMLRWKKLVALKKPTKMWLSRYRFASNRMSITRNFIIIIIEHT